MIIAYAVHRTPSSGWLSVTLISHLVAHRLLRLLHVRKEQANSYIYLLSPSSHFAPSHTATQPSDGELLFIDKTYPWRLLHLNGIPFIFGLFLWNRRQSMCEQVRECNAQRQRCDRSVDGAENVRPPWQPVLCIGISLCAACHIHIGIVVYHL